MGDDFNMDPSWCRCDEGETIEKTIYREIQEETGITKFEIKSFLSEVAGLKKGDKVLVFAATTEQEPTLMEPDKFSEWMWVNFKDYKNNSLGISNVEVQGLVINYIKSL